MYTGGCTDSRQQPGAGSSRSPRRSCRTEWASPAPLAELLGEVQAVARLLGDGRAGRQAIARRQDGGRRLRRRRRPAAAPPSTTAMAPCHRLRNVTISRLLFRSGQSEYAINGDQCRLLDIAELLSDTGLGREMHVIVGQGQLDEVLNAGPEARRALIEEAAGVLKHRRRKEKAVRKLDAMQANLTRLVDLTGELGRRLKPLGRQAEIARKAAAIQADLRDAKLRLLADDYAILADELAQDETDEAATAQARAALEAGLAQAREVESELELAEQQHAPRLAAAQEAFFALSGLAERLRGVHGLAAERHRHLSAPEPQRTGRDPEELEQEAAELRAQERQLADRLAGARQQLTASVAGRTRAEAALAENEKRLAADAKAAAQRAESLARIRSQVEAAASRSGAAQEEAGRWPKRKRRPGPGQSKRKSSTRHCKTWCPGGKTAGPISRPRTSTPLRRWRRLLPGWRGCARLSIRPATSARPCGPGPRRGGEQYLQHCPP